jgi:hypothetical protein
MNKVAENTMKIMDRNDRLGIAPSEPDEDDSSTVTKMEADGSEETSSMVATSLKR